MGAISGLLFACVETDCFIWPGQSHGSSIINLKNLKHFLIKYQHKSIMTSAKELTKSKPFSKRPKMHLTAT